MAMRDGVMTEADTCREFVTPRLVEAGWGNSPCAIGEQRSFTNGRIIVAGGKVRRGQQKRADYLLYYRRDYPLAVVEAKEVGLPAETGVQQAREYAEILGLKLGELEDIALFDEYCGQQIQAGKKSLAFTFMLRAEDHTLSDDEIKKAMEAMIDALKQAGAPLRA